MRYYRVEAEDTPELYPKWAWQDTENCENTIVFFVAGFDPNNTMITEDEYKGVLMRRHAEQLKEK